MIIPDNYVKEFKMTDPWTGEEMNMRCRYLTYEYGGNVCLQLFNDEGPYLTATTNVVGALEPEEVAIKDYGDNPYDMVEILVDAGITNEPHRYISSGHIANIPVCTLKEVE